jgi:hypothetical protein
VAGAGELVHVEADLGDDHLGRVGADAGDLVQAGDDRQRGAGRAAAAAAVIGCLGGGDGGDQLLDAAGQRLDLGAEGVDLVEQQAGELGVVVIEAAGERLHQGGRFARSRPRASPASM